ncbi:MAG: hypothetical protein IJV67_00585 [Clostridia bacterium]|nr:hypothetical protein [Clostridia bacterium]
MRKMFYVGQTVCWLALCFVAVFYGWIFRGRQMQAWSIILLVCAGLGYLACLAVGVRFVHNGEVERSEKVLSIIALLPVYVLIALPALFMLLFFSDRGKDGFIFLKKHGFKRQKADGEIVYSKDQTVLRIKSGESYDISFDGGESFLPVEDTELGTQEERDELVAVSFNYLKNGRKVTAEVDTDAAFAEFIKRYVAN